MIGIGLGLTTLRGGGAFTPLSLFAGGEDGAWYDPSDISSLFQDTAGTTPIVTSGQTIARVNDKSGNDLNATQPATAARPSYIVDADGAFIQHDPVDDALTVTLPDLGTVATVAYVTRSEVRLLEDQTISGSYTLPQQELAGFVVIDRALTFAEKVNLIRYLASKVDGVNYGAEIDRLTLIAINAVDVFVYDTSKDSDGGTWATDYPAQMIIVADTANVKIYDATDPGLPLHTTFDFTGYTVRALTAVSGVLAVATTAGLATFNLADDDTTVALDYTTSTTPAIVSNTVNDVAMTVLPDAPIDPATGLLMPTIAVATAGGVSVITDDGTVVDSSKTTAATDATIDGGRLHVAFTDSDVLAYDIAAIAADGFTGDIYDPATTPALLGTASSLADAASGSTLGVTLLAEDETTPASSMITNTTSTYNTGWMPGDIKGAFLSDTDDADLVGGDLVTNGTFDTDANWVKPSGVTITGGETVFTSVGNGQNFVQSAGFYPAVVEGKTYLLEFEIKSISSGGLSPIVAANPGETFSTVGVHKSIVVAGSNQAFTGLKVFGGITTAVVDNISVKLVDADRSVNNNGMIVNGTVTRSPVADGADLVAYSGFSAANYLDGTDASYADTLYALGWEQTSGVWEFKHGTVSTAPIDGLTITGTTLKIAGTKPKALIRISVTTPSADQLAKIEADESALFQENAQATLYGASDAVTALAHDPDTDLLHVGTSAGRSIFDGLHRVGNTTTSVSTAISASGGLVVEK